MIIDGTPTKALKVDLIEDEKIMAKKSDFDKRLDIYYDELKWLYYELYHSDFAAFEYFVDMLRRMYEDRSTTLKAWDK